MRRDRAPSLFDVGLAAFTTAVMVGGSIGEAHPARHVTAAQLRWLETHQPGGAYALVALAGCALIFRRTWPLAVLAVTVGAVGAYSAAGFVPGAALCGVYVALFSIGVSQSRPVVLAGTLGSVILLFVTAGAGGPFGWFGGTNSVMIACCVASVAVGLAVAGRRQVFSAMVERAERAERDREEEARRRVDAERLRIARELHDVVAHSMSMIHIQAGVAAHVLPTQPDQAAEALTAIKEASREGLRELRAILNVLRQVDSDPDQPRSYPGTDSPTPYDHRSPAPRLAQLEALAAATTQGGLPTALAITGDISALSPAMELAVYRIVQESLTNVLRHAGPRVAASVEVAVNGDTVTVVVDDDGCGTASGDFDDGSGTGITGMRERTAAFGGTLEAGPPAGPPRLGPGRGWRVRAVLPLLGDELPGGEPVRRDPAERLP
ncbi:MAG TPA: histidine kinase [Acidimicrobiales bacterium]|nr:histidine kinase [Acidimicrobiales bacterium]